MKNRTPQTQTRHMTRVGYQVTRADGTVEPEVMGPWYAVDEPAPEPRNLLRRLLSKFNKKVV